MTFDEFSVAIRFAVQGHLEKGGILAGVFDGDLSAGENSRCPIGCLLPEHRYWSAHDASKELGIRETDICDFNASFDAGHVLSYGLDVASPWSELGAHYAHVAAGLAEP